MTIAIMPFILQYLMPFLIQIFQENNSFYVQTTNFSLETISFTTNLTDMVLLPIISERSEGFRIYSPEISTDSLERIPFSGTTGIFNSVFTVTYLPFQTKRSFMMFLYERQIPIAKDSKAFLRYYAFLQKPGLKTRMFFSNFLQLIPGDQNLLKSKILFEREVDHHCITAQKRVSAAFLGMIDSEFVYKDNMKRDE